MNELSIMAEISRLASHIKFISGDYEKMKLSVNDKENMVETIREKIDIIDGLLKNLE